MCMSFGSRKQFQQPHGELRRESQVQDIKSKCTQRRDMGIKGQLKDPSDLAEAPTVSATASVDLKGFPSLEESDEPEERDGVTRKTPCIC